MYNIDTVIDETIINTLIKLGHEYKEKKNYDLSEKSYRQALELRATLSNSDPLKHKPLLIEILDALALLYKKQNTYNIAIQYYREITTLARVLYEETKSKAYISLLATTHSKIATLHKKHDNRILAKHFFTEALENYTLLLEEENYTYNHIAIFEIYQELTFLFEEEGMFKHAQEHYKKALVLGEQLIERGLEQYHHELGKLHCDLASLYFFQAMFEEAEEHYNKSLDIIFNHIQEDSETYTESIAIAQNNLASIYATQKKYDKALIFYKKALPHLSSLAEANPAKYGHNIAVLFRNLASIHFHQNKMEKAEFFHLKSIEIFKEFSEYNAEKYNLELATSLIDGVEYYGQHSLSLYKAESILRKYSLNRDTAMLLGRISTLRRKTVKERV